LVPYLQTVKRVILLTGTPVLNKNVEMFSLLKIIRPDCFNDPYEFQSYFCGRGYYSSFTNEMVYPSITKTAEFRLIFSNVALRRLKSDVLTQLPSKIRHRVIVKMEGQSNCVLSGSNSELLQQVRDLDMDFMKYTKKDRPHAQKNVSISKLSKMYSSVATAKIESIFNFAKELIDHRDVLRLVIFMHHRRAIDELSMRFKEGKIRCEFITGSTPDWEKQQTLKSFQDLSSTTPSFNKNKQNAFMNCKNPDKPRPLVLILSLTSACTGLTLTASSTVIFGELSWVPAILEQAEDRVHRISQTKSVNIYYLIGMKTIDEYIYDLLEKKSRDIGQFLDKNEKGKFNQFDKFGNMKFDKGKKTNKQIDYSYKKDSQSEAKIVDPMNREP